MYELHGNHKPKPYDNQKIRKKESKHIIKESHHVLGNRTRKGAKKNYKNNKKTFNKMARSIYQLIISRNVNGLNDQIKRHKD